MSPFVLLLYPVWIIPVTFGLGIYGGFSQISWYWPNWRKELTDPEKGDLPPDVSSLLILFVQASSAGCVTSCVSPTAPRTRWSSSRPSGARTPAPSPASSELSKDSIKILLCCCLPPYWHSRQNLPLEYIYCLPLLFVWIALLMIERQTSCQKFLYTSDLKILKYLSTVSYFSMFSKTLPIYTFSSHL